MIRQLRSSLVWYAFIAPTFLLFGLFVVYPTFETFRLSFFREVATRQEFVGAIAATWTWKRSAARENISPPEKARSSE